MAVRETITVSMTPELRYFIRARLKFGHYGNAGKIARAGLCLLIKQDQGDGLLSFNTEKTIPDL